MIYGQKSFRIRKNVTFTKYNPALGLRQNMKYLSTLLMLLKK